MRELGHRGGKALRKGVAEQLPEGERQSLPQFLRDGLDHETIKAAIERSLAGGNESARVACVKFLSDLELYRRDDDHEDRIAAGQKAAAEAREYLARELARRARFHEQQQVRDALDELAAELDRQAVAEHPDLIVGDVSSERAAAILEQLEELGLLVRPSRVAELAEEMAQERLAALKQEHGLPGV